MHLPVNKVQSRVSWKDTQKITYCRYVIECLLHQEVRMGCICMHCCLLSAGRKKQASIKDLSSLRERDTGPGKMRRDQEEVPTHTHKRRREERNFGQGKRESHGSSNFPIHLFDHLTRNATDLVTTVMYSIHTSVHLLAMLKKYYYSLLPPSPKWMSSTTAPHVLRNNDYLMMSLHYI